MQASASLYCRAFWRETSAWGSPMRAGTELGCRTCSLVHASLHIEASHSSCVTNVRASSSLSDRMQRGGRKSERGKTPHLPEETFEVHAPATIASPDCVPAEQRLGTPNCLPRTQSRSITGFNCRCGLFNMDID